MRAGTQMPDFCMRVGLPCVIRRYEVHCSREISSLKKAEYKSKWDQDDPVIDEAKTNLSSQFTYISVARLGIP